MNHILRSTAALAGIAMLAALGVQTSASAQQESYGCGHYSPSGVWIAMPCPAPAPRAIVRGTIVDVDNNMLTLQTGPTQTVMVNDRIAADRQAEGPIYPGRVVAVYGYWDRGQFMATSVG